MYNHNFIYSKIWFYSKIIIFVYLFIYLSNADVENCGEVKGFGFIYIYRLVILLTVVSDVTYVVNGTMT